MPELLSTKEAAAFLGITVSLLSYKRRIGGGPRFYQLGAHTFKYAREDLTEWFESCRLAQ